MKQIFSVLSVTCVAFFTLFLSTTNVSCKKGDTGPKGDTGVANAIYSSWTQLNYNSQGDTIFWYEWAAPKITKEVLDKAEIKVYANIGTAAAPNIIHIPYFNGLFLINVDYEVGKINLVSNGDGSAPYRYVIVNPSIQARAASINWNNYEEVKKALNLQD